MTYESWRCTYQDSEQAARAAFKAAREAWAEAERLRAELTAMTPKDPMDWKLPCDVTVGHGTISKGCSLRTLVTRMKVLYSIAVGESTLKRNGQVGITPGVFAIANERLRQIEVEGWTPEHDDLHSTQELAFAAACYATADAGDPPPAVWPWDLSWWKPASRRRNLEKAGALIAAELDQLIRKENEA